MAARLSDETRAIVRNAGLLVTGTAVAMMLLTLGAMLWMDVPLLVLGLGLLGYAWLDQRRARDAAQG